MFRLIGLGFREQKKSIHLFLLHELKIWLFEKRAVSRGSRPDLQNNECVILMILSIRPSGPLALSFWVFISFLHTLGERTQD